jgi:hypothetical protein
MGANEAAKKACENHIMKGKFRPCSCKWMKENVTPKYSKDTMEDFFDWQDQKKKQIAAAMKNKQYDPVAAFAYAVKTLGPITGQGRGGSLSKDKGFPNRVCSKGAGHKITIVGWDRSGAWNEAYWIIRNSHGPDRPGNGYMRVRMYMTCKKGVPAGMGWDMPK